MPRYLLSLIFLLTMPIAILAQDADYDTGKQAFLDGEYARALEILEPLAEAGHSQAQVTLGIMYDNGNGVREDPEEAFRWYMMAAEQGFPIVQHQVAFKYLHGIGVEQNYQEAAKWWELSANAGLADSQFNLALMLYRGLGVDQDLDRARQLFTAAAEQGHGHAQYSLAVMYAFGQGVEKDYEQAIKWFHKSAVQDVAQAQYNLGIFYENGFGISADAETARLWYEKAAANGLKQARDKLDQLEHPEVADASPQAVLQEPVMTEPVMTTEPAPMTETESSQPATATDRTGNAIRNEDWVMQQSPEHYTLQIGSSVNEQKIINLIRDNSLTEQAAYIRVVVSGVTRFSALYGVFDTFNAAESAARELPEHLQKAGPWVRNFGILQKLINDSRP